MRYELVVTSVPLDLKQAAMALILGLIVIKSIKSCVIQGTIIRHGISSLLGSI